MIVVMTKATTRMGKVYPSVATDYSVEFGRKTASGYASVTVFRSREGEQSDGTTFAVGDEAEYNSYNLSYTGTITKITDKGVTIVAYQGSNIEKTHRLSLNDFCWRNWNFNAVEVAKKNAEEMMYL